MTNTIPNVPRELLERVKSLCEYWFVRGQQQHMSESEHKTWHALGFGSSAFTELRALLSAPSPAGVDGLGVVGYVSQDDIKWQGDCTLRIKPYSDYVIPLCRLSDAKAVIDGLRGEAARLREERDSFQRIGIRQIEHRYQLAALLLEKFPRIDPHHPITLSEVDHCCEYVLHKDRERLHCAIDAALSAVCAAAPNIATTSEHSGS